MGVMNWLRRFFQIKEEQGSVAEPSFRFVKVGFGGYVLRTNFTIFSEVRNLLAEELSSIECVRTYTECNGDIIVFIDQPNPELKDDGKVHRQGSIVKKKAWKEINALVKRLIAEGFFVRKESS